MSDHNPKSNTTNSSLNYQGAGVNIEAGNQLVERIKSTSKATHRSEVLGNLGGFGALCQLPSKYQEPILVAGTDGVGTKLALANTLNHHTSIGIDLVAMCVNDLIVQGAEPLFFLDYYATGKLNIDIAEQVIQGIGEGCQQAGCALIGGETAEMPGMYQGEDYDLAGFCVGVVEKSAIIDGSKLAAGNTLIALASSGPHSNGYSLIRQVIARSKAELGAAFDEQATLGEVLLTPTRIYIKSLLALIEQIPVNAMAHITGGGLVENIPRVLPPQLSAVIDLNSWQLPAIFSWLQQQGNILEMEMLRTFNCGVGMVISVDSQHSSRALEILSENGEQAWIIGSIKDNSNAQNIIFQR